MKRNLTATPERYEAQDYILRYIQEGIQKDLTSENYNEQVLEFVLVHAQQLIKNWYKKDQFPKLGSPEQPLKEILENLKS